jgi:hypothetical protein
LTCVRPLSPSWLSARDIAKDSADIILLEKSLAVLGDGVIEDPAVLLAWRLPGLRPATSGLLARALSYPPVLCHPDAIHEDMVHSTVRVKLSAASRRRIEAN